MAVLQVYTKCVKTKYKSKIISQSTFLVLILGTFTIVSPLIFAYKSKGFWMKHDTFFEQPDVRFLGEYLFVATTNNLSHPITCGTYGYYQQYIKDFDKCSLIKVREVDDNFDGKVDEIRIYLEITLPDNLKITSFTIIFPLDYQVHTSCNLQMQSAIIYQNHFRDLVSELSVFGDLALSQSSPLTCHGISRNSFYNKSLIEDEEDLESYRVDNILRSYTRRNISTHLTNTYTNMLLGNIQDFKINFHIRYPQHRFYYQPGFWQIIKHAWIQYYSIYIVVGWIIHRIKNFIFVNRMVLFYEDCPIKKNR